MPPRKPKAEKAVKQPSARRSITSWSVSLVRVAQIRADAGDMRLVGELTEELLADDRIGGTMRTRVQALLGLTPTFEASGDGRRKTRAVKALEGQEDWWSIFPETELALVLSTALMAGVCPAQLVSTERKGDADVVRYRDGRIVPQMQFWEPTWLRFDNATEQWSVELDGGNRLPITPGDGRWMLWTPFGARRPHARGMWRGLAPWWLLKQYAIADFGRVGENAATRVVTSDKEAKSTHELRGQLAAMVAELGAEGVVALPAGFDLSLVEVAASTHELYQAQISMADTAIAVAILGHANNAEVKGANTGATEGGNIRADLRKFDGEIVSTTTREQGLTVWAGWNFGDTELAPWPSYPTNPKDVLAEVETLDKLGDALGKLVKVDKGVDVRTILEDAKVPIVKGAPRPEDMPKPEPPTPPPPPPPGTPQADPAADAGVAPATPAKLAKKSDPRAVAARHQAWVDALVHEGTRIDAMRGVLDKVQAAIDSAESPEALKAALVDLAADASDDQAEVFERLLVLAASAGSAAVAEEGS